MASFITYKAEIRPQSYYLLVSQYAIRLMESASGQATWLGKYEKDMK